MIIAIPCLSVLISGLLLFNVSVRDDPFIWLLVPFNIFMFFVSYLTGEMVRRVSNHLLGREAFVWRNPQ